MIPGGEDSQVLLEQSVRGDASALRRLFEKYRPRLKRMILLRMDQRVQGLIDPSTVLDAVLAALPERLSGRPSEEEAPTETIHLWLRSLTAECLADIQQDHLGEAQADNTVSLHQGRMPQANSVFLASQLLGRVVPADNDEGRAEMRVKLQQVLNAMEAGDREILALKHFEELETHEIGQVLNMKPAQVAQHYIRALRRLQQAIRQLPGWPT